MELTEAPRNGFVVNLFGVMRTVGVVYVVGQKQQLDNYVKNKDYDEG
jgi:hypothetical protein